MQDDQQLTDRPSFHRQLKARLRGLNPRLSSLTVGVLVATALNQLSLQMGFFRWRTYSFGDDDPVDTGTSEVCHCWTCFSLRRSGTACAGAIFREVFQITGAA